MSRKNKEFYVWAMSECIKDTYENWGTDMMSMYSNIRKDFPNAAKAIHKIYSDFRGNRDCYEAEPLTFENPQFVYEAIANLIPNYKELKHDSYTKALCKEYSCLEMCSWNRFVSIERIDLVMAILLFTEEFIFKPITSEIVVLTDTKLTVNGKFVTLEVSREEEKTCVNIEIKDVIILQYVILN